ncbi:MAG: barstar family protein [Clostridiales bacterium]|nr:barstar family protein [Clostridiales bacterium]
MQTICLFASDYDSPASLHRALKSLLSLPEYYGMNADALNDCLSEMPVVPSLWIRREGPEDAVRTLDLIARVFRDNGGEVREL